MKCRSPMTLSSFTVGIGFLCLGLTGCASMDVISPISAAAEGSYPVTLTVLNMSGEALSLDISLDGTVLYAGTVIDPKMAPPIVVNKLTTVPPGKHLVIVRDATRLMEKRQVFELRMRTCIEVGLGREEVILRVIQLPDGTIMTYE